MARLQRTFRVPFPCGLHARPAAELVRLARCFDARIEVINAPLRADAKSLLQILILCARAGDSVRVLADGAEAAAAMTAISAWFARAAQRSHRRSAERGAADTGTRACTNSQRMNQSLKEI